VPAGRRARRCSCPHFCLASKPQAPCHPRAARGPVAPPPGSLGRERRLHPDGVCDPRALDEDGAATSATSRVSMNATLSSPACPPQVGGPRWWESVRTMSASTCASSASLLPPDTWPSWPVPPATAGRSSLACRVLPRCRRAGTPAGTTPGTCRPAARAARRSPCTPAAQPGWPRSCAGSRPLTGTRPTGTRRDSCRAPAGPGPGEWQAPEAVAPVGVCRCRDGQTRTRVISLAG
jgi:hypothetical protein